MIHTKLRKKKWSSLFIDLVTVAERLRVRTGSNRSKTGPSHDGSSDIATYVHVHVKQVILLWSLEHQSLKRSSFNQIIPISTQPSQHVNRKSQISELCSTSQQAETQPTTTRTYDILIESHWFLANERKYRQRYAHFCGRTRTGPYPNPNPYHQWNVSLLSVDPSIVSRWRNIIRPFVGSTCSFSCQQNRVKVREAVVVSLENSHERTNKSSEPKPCANHILFFSRKSLSKISTQICLQKSNAFS